VERERKRETGGEQSRRLDEWGEEEAPYIWEDQQEIEREKHQFRPVCRLSDCPDKSKLLDVGEDTKTRIETERREERQQVGGRVGPEDRVGVADG
jgi:hypothetical protein